MVEWQEYWAVNRDDIKEPHLQTGSAENLHLKDMGS
jgi:hypothetical protein